MSLSARALGTLWSMTWRYMCSNVALASQMPSPGIRSRSCVYCGDPATTTDHLRPVIGRGGLPTGFGPDRWNIVPACALCNSSKGNQDWYTFMTRKSGKAPLARKTVDPAVHAWRISRLRTFEQNGTKAAMRWAVHLHAHEIKEMRCALKKAIMDHERRVYSMKSKAWRQRQEDIVVHMMTRAATARQRRILVTRARKYEVLLV